MAKPDLRAVQATTPEPPYPKDTKIRGWRLQIDMDRIRQSDTWALAPTDMRPWLLMLWVTSWEQIPAGSYTDDDEIIAARIGMDFRTFQGNRKFLMRGWVKHTDGRLYHAVIGEQVLGHINYRVTEAERKRDYREREAERKRQEAIDNQNVPRDNHGTPPDSHDRPAHVPVASGHQNENENENENENISGEKEDPSKDLCRANAATGRSNLPPWGDVHTVLEHLNAKTGQHFQTRNGKGAPTKNAENVRRRLAEYDLQTCISVIDKKCDDWLGDDSMEKYLRPGTLFRPEKFEQYVGAAKKEPKKYGSFLDDDNVIETTWSRDK